MKEAGERKKEWMNEVKKKFIPEETAKEIEMMKTIKGFESSKDIDEVIKRILLAKVVVWKILTPWRICAKSIKRKCVHIINLKLIQIAFVIMECFGRKTEQVQRMYVFFFSYMGFKTHKF